MFYLIHNLYIFNCYYFISFLMSQRYIIYYT
nr:MAG TPA_asm: hypothetical protein [Caudoviricetes sp.]